MKLQRWSSHDAVASPHWSLPFPSAWWQELLQGDVVSLTLVAEGPVVVVGYSEDGARRIIRTVHDEGERIPFSIRADDWLAIEVPSGSVLREATWSAEVDVDLPGVAAVVPTFRREKDAIHQAAAFLGSELVRQVIVVDQGGTLHEEDGFIRLQSEHGQRLRLIQQANLGGSGGYARGMIESDPECAVLLSDDDAALPHESLRRMLIAQALAARSSRKLVMGTPMFSAERPSMLISAAERVDFGDFQWGAADGLREPVDVSEGARAVLDAIAVRQQPNYSGWWGTLLPPGTVPELGLPAPFFLKWDDAEYGLRACARGYEFMTLPGTGVWHPTWGAHKTLTTWVAVLLHRNRLATASAYGAGRGVIRDSFIHQAKHILSLQYDVAKLWEVGINQFLAGPSWLGSDLADARENAQAAVDSLPRTEVGGKVPEQRRRLGAVPGAIRSLVGLVAGLSGVESTCPAAEFTWRDGVGMDRVVLTDADGAVVSEMMRDPRRARALLASTARQHLRLARRWRAFTPLYRDALEHSTTADYWHSVLGIRR